METWGEWPQLLEVESEDAWEKKNLLEHYRVFRAGTEGSYLLCLGGIWTFLPRFQVNEMIRQDDQDTQAWEIGPVSNLTF